MRDQRETLVRYIQAFPLEALEFRHNTTLKRAQQLVAQVSAAAHHPSGQFYAT